MSRADEICREVGFLAHWRFLAGDALRQGGSTVSKVRTFFREFDDAQRGILMHLHEGRPEEVERRLEQMRRFVAIVDGSQHSEPKAPVLQ